MRLNQIDPGVRKRKMGLYLLFLTVFLLFAAPRLGVKLGSVPIYAIDILLALTLLQAIRFGRRLRWSRVSKIVLVILTLALISEIGGVLRFGIVLEPAYMIARTFLAFSLFYSLQKLVSDSAELRMVMLVAVAGCLVTALLMILSSLPMTRGVVTSYVFSNQYLEPATDTIVELLNRGVGGMRGQSLVGVSILSGAAINIGLPLALYLIRIPGDDSNWPKLLARAYLVLAPFGVVFSYSRGAILGLVLIVLGIVIFAKGRLRTAMVASCVVSIIVLNYVGWGADVFYFDRLEVRTSAMFSAPTEDVRETERLYAYIEPFEHVINNPSFLLIGEGLASTKLGYQFRDVIVESGDFATHAVFAKAYYKYGMIAALLYVFALGFALLTTFRIASREKELVRVSQARVVFASLLGIIPWFLFGHAAVSQPRGAMLFVFVLALSSVIIRLQPSSLLHRSVQGVGNDNPHFGKLVSGYQ